MTITGAYSKTNGHHGETRFPPMNIQMNQSTTRSSSRPSTRLVSDTCWTSISRENIQSYSWEVQAQERHKSSRTTLHPPELTKSHTRPSTSHPLLMQLHSKETSSPCLTKSQVKLMVLPWTKLSLPSLTTSTCLTSKLMVPKLQSSYWDKSSTTAQSSTENNSRKESSSRICCSSLAWITRVVHSQLT